MIEGTTSEGGARDNRVRRGLALVASLLVVLWTAWLTIAAPADARPASSAGPPPTTTSSSTTTTTRPPQTTTTARPTTTTTAPPQTTESTSPPTSDDPPVTEDTEPDDEEEPEEEPEETVPTRDADLLGLSPISTSVNLLVGGNGTPGSETAQAPVDDTTKDGGSSDEDRVIWMIIAALGAVALLVALLTWRYWLLTRPGIDLSDDPDDGGSGGGGGYYGGEPPAPPSDPYGAAPPRMADVNPMTTGLPPAPAATGWQEPASPPRPPQRRGPDRGPGPAPDPARRARPPRRAEADPFPSQPAAPPQRGRGRGRRGGDPFWDDVGDQAPRRQPPDQGRRRPDPGDLGERDPWGRGG